MALPMTQLPFLSNFGAGISVAAPNLSGNCFPGCHYISLMPRTFVGRLSVSPDFPRLYLLVFFTYPPYSISWAPFLSFREPSVDIVLALLRTAAPLLAAPRSTVARQSLPIRLDAP